MTGTLDVISVGDRQVVGTRAPQPADEEVWPIAVLHWPAEAARSEHLARQHRLRLYVVAPGHAPPVDLEGLSDWIRGPADAIDIYARVEALQRRAPTPPRFGAEIVLDQHGLLWRTGKGWVALTPIEESMMRALLERPGRVVTRHELLAAVGSTDDTTGMLDTRLARLRRRIAELGAHIVNVRQRGYLVELEEDAVRVPPFPPADRSRLAVGASTRSAGSAPLGASSGR